MDGHLLRLHTFGGVGVTDEQGEPAPGTLAQHRPVALLVIVAASGRQGVSRDKLAGILWPDAPTARARHSLTQCLYGARRIFRADDLFLIDGVIRLNPARIWTDVGAFVRAVESGDVETVADLYAGPFLDGFGSAIGDEYHRWIRERRAQFEDQAIDSIDALADRANQAGDVAKAVILRKRLAGMRPLDTPQTTKLIDLLVRTRQPVEAARRADEHESMLRALGLAPDQAFAEVAETLRTPVTQRVSEVGTSLFPAAIAPRRPNRRRFVAITTGALVIAVAISRLYVSPAPARSAQTHYQPLLVVPFDPSGTSAPMAYLGTAIAELLAPRLALDSLAYPVDAGTVLSRFRARFGTTAAIPRDSLIALAADLGATRLVIGTVSGTSSRIVIESALLTLPSGVEVATASVEGQADSLTSLAAGLAAKLLVAESGDNARIAERWRGSLIALRRLVSGRLADRRGDYVAAARQYEAALAADSSLAPAALALAVAADRIGNAEVEADAVARAWAHRDLLGEDERGLLLAFAGADYPRPSSTEAQWRSWTALAGRDIRKADGWLQLAARLFHEGSRLGRTDVADRATVAVRRALAIEGENRAALSLLRAINASQFGKRPPDSLTADVHSMTDARTLAMFALWSGADAYVSRSAIRLLEQRASTTTEAIDAVMARHSLTVNHGLPADALAATTRLHELRPDSHAYLRLRILDAVYGNGDTVAARVAARQLATTVDATSDGFPLERRRRAADGCVVAQWKLAQGDTSGVRAIIVFLRGQQHVGHAPLVSATPRVCAELLDAALAVAGRKTGAMNLLARLDSLSLTTAVAGNADMYEHILIARLYRALGHPRRALAAIRKRGYMLGWPTYLATTWREERDLAAQVGDTVGARVAERALSGLRSDSGF